MIRTPRLSGLLEPDLPPIEPEPLPTCGALGPPAYSDFSDLFPELAPPATPAGTAKGPPQYPGMDSSEDPDMARRWIVVRVPSTVEGPAIPWKKGPVKIVGGFYGIVASDEAERWDDWSGPYTEEEANEVVQDMTEVRRIMER